MEPQGYINSVNLKKDTAFPYLVLDVVDDSSVPRNPGFQVMHWHEDLQFVYLLSGEVEVITLEARAVLRAGEGAFLNKNVVHLIKRGASCHYKSFIFPDYFLKFYPGSPAADAVTQLVGCEQLPLLCIADRPENQPILDALRALTELEQHKTPLYPYAVLTTLCTLWLALCRVAGAPQPRPEKTTAGRRMALFLRYIAQHYAEPLTLEALAAAAHVSKSECLRCFRATLQTSPYQYLTEYRLSRAAALLRGTDLPIGEIAVRTGFGQASHFGKCFREKTGLSPSAYRKQNATPTALRGSSGTPTPT